MCGGGGSKSTKPKVKEYDGSPNARAIADTSNDYASRRAVVATTMDQQTEQPSTFGSELGGS